MIQRVQSIWLFLAGLSLFLLTLLPIVTHLADAPTGPEPSVAPLLYSTIILGIVCIASIFAFRNRTLQKNIIRIIILLILCLCGWIYFSLQALPGGLDHVKPSIGAFLPILAIIFCLLAIRGIRKDEQLIRSADRLR